MQAAAGEVNSEGQAAFAQVGVNADVGGFGIHIGAAMQGVAQLVGNGVFDFERAELGVANTLADAVEVDGEGVIGAQVLVPGDGAGRGVDVIGVCHFAFSQLPQNPARHA